jgi:hypothetical protein
MRNLSFYILLLIFVGGCGVNKSVFSPSKKYSPAQLQKDYTLYEDILESHHPGLYWYTSKDSMDYYFNWGREKLKDSLTEPEFRKVLNYVTAKINCGHTSVRPSKKWYGYADTVRIGKMFPLSFKVWDKAMVVTANLNRRDSILKRGVVITAINGRRWEKIVDTLFEYMTTDGYNKTHKYQTISNRGFFSSLYTSLFGLADRYTVDYIDSTGKEKRTVIPVYNPATDPTIQGGTRPLRPPAKQPSKKERREIEKNSVRLLKIDTLTRTAMMDLGSFGRGYGLRQFFRNSFRALKSQHIDYLIIDVRSNGGGSVTNSTLLSRYVASGKFKVADSLYSIRKNSPYQKYIDDHFWNRLFMFFFTRKKPDGYHHFGYFERHFFNPKHTLNYKGKVYIMTGGNSFSATTLFVSSVIKQDNVTIVGEETGGGAYGNSAWLIPDATLPETGVRFRLPLFRLVIDKNVQKGYGVQPEIFSLPTIEAVTKGNDYKLDKVLQLIKEDKEKKSRPFNP